MELTYNEVIIIHNQGLPQLAKVDTKGKAVFSVFLLQLHAETSRICELFRTSHSGLVETYVEKETVEGKQKHKVEIDDGKEKYCFETTEKEAEYIKQLTALRDAKVQINITKLPVSAIEGIQDLTLEKLGTIYKLIDINR